MSLCQIDGPIELTVYGTDETDFAAIGIGLGGEPFPEEDARCNET
jgi:hypothetical protein